MSTDPLPRNHAALFGFRACWQRSHRAIRGAASLLAVAVLVAMSTSIAYGQAGYAFPAPVAVGTTSAAQTVPVTITTAGTLATINVLTGGAANLDFNAAGGSCTTTGYSAGQSCTVAVTMTAKAPGIRSGAVTLVDGNGIVLGTEFLYGVGVGPLSVFNAGEITTVAGNGQLATGTTLGTVAVDAVIHEPVGVAVDGSGNFYYTDNGNNLIGKVDPSGNLTIIAGTGTAGFSPNGTPAASAQINAPSAIAVDGAGNVFFTEYGNSTVREIVSATGLIETVAGTGTAGYAGDGGAANAAVLSQPEGLAFDSANNLYIADTGNNVIRKISAATGTITTFAGTGVEGFGGDGGPAAQGMFDEPWGIAATSDGSVYVADFKNNRVRKIDPSGTLSTVAGTSAGGYSGDGGPANAAQLDHPAGVVLDAAGDMFLSDSDNSVVRRVSAASQLINTLVGNGTADSSGDGVDANNGSVTVNKPYGLTLDASGDLFIADRLGLKIREVYGKLAFLGYKDIKATNTSQPLPQEIDNEGNAPLHISAITPVTNAVIDSASTTCSTTGPLGIGNGCVVGVDFKPATVGSPATGTVTIASDSVTSPITIDLSGNALSIDPTTTAMTSSVNPSAVGAAVTFTATVSSQSTTLTGTVEFLDGSTVLGGTAQILNSTTRTATYTTTSLALGSHSITAVYSGDNENETSTSSPAVIQVVKQTSSLNLSSNLNPAQVYDPIIFTVNASALPAGGVTPTGSIVFSADGSLLPNGTIGLSNGVASYTTALLPAGTHTITASYSGDTRYAGGQLERADADYQRCHDHNHADHVESERSSDGAGDVYRFGCGGEHIDPDRHRDLQRWRQCDRVRDGEQCRAGFANLLFAEYREPLDYGRVQRRCGLRGKHIAGAYPDDSEGVDRRCSFCQCQSCELRRHRSVQCHGDGDQHHITEHPGHRHGEPDGGRDAAGVGYAGRGGVQARRVRRYRFRCRASRRGPMRSRRSM